MKAPSKLALSIIDGVERRAVERAAQGLPAANRAEVAADIDKELTSVVEALKSASIALHYHWAQERSIFKKAEIRETLVKVYDALGTPKEWYPS